MAGIYNIYKSIDTLIERSRFHLDARLSESQIVTNKNVRETNENIRETNKNITTTNIRLKWIFILTGAVYLLQLIVSIIGVFQTSNNTQTQSQIEKQATTIKTMEMQFYQIKNQNVYYLHEIDSLKNASVLKH